MSSQTIARLAEPFDGGLGPSHATIAQVWLSEDALEYLPTEGNKSERVIGGLRALREGRRGPPTDALAPDHDKLMRVADQLATRLLASGLLEKDDIPEILGQKDVAPATSPAATKDQEPAPAGSPDVEETQVSALDAPIFVVHGHDHALLFQAVRVLEHGTGREVIVLHEQANEGRTVLEKFEHHAGLAAFAVVLLTPDDFGGARDGESRPRGRQNVIFELGFFYGKLGRRRVAVLVAPGVEAPSDIAGLVYIAVDEAGGWKFSLGRELHAAGITVDYRRIP